MLSLHARDGLQDARVVRVLSSSQLNGGIPIGEAMQVAAAHEDFCYRNVCVDGLSSVRDHACLHELGDVVAYGARVNSQVTTVTKRRKHRRGYSA